LAIVVLHEECAPTLALMLEQAATPPFSSQIIASANLQATAPHRPEPVSVVSMRLCVSVIFGG
jgi:hypothetical protein